MKNVIPLLSLPLIGTTLYLAQHQGEPYVPMRPVVNGTGLDGKSRRRKLTDPDDIGRFSVVILTTVGAAHAKERELVCLPLRRAFGWLMTIRPEKVRPALREKIAHYQKECDEVLWQHWTRRSTAPPAQNCCLMPYLALTRGRWGHKITSNGYNATSLKWLR